ncbi:hypothetical protein [Flavobacterium sharifuzzamanii]|uniref:hypothetical protein n=1 Tax=Flavobacterium sharifuzzamanii TaxID=2211133 RepID=UPI000DABFBEB|nr:hypothetical protein [Flavobacterium sharifuzzamanii]KAF2080423.1 hypothetical protein DMA14_14095 [Flavobacterium sharifuzzamanii]
MKKTALTIGLFSLVVVATSFASTEVPTYLASNDSIKVLPIDGTTTTGGGAAGGVIRKHDFHGGAESFQKNSNANFASVNQAFGHDKKVD